MACDFRAWEFGGCRVAPIDLFVSYAFVFCFVGVFIQGFACQRETEKGFSYVDCSLFVYQWGMFSALVCRRVFNKTGIS